MARVTSRLAEAKAKHISGEADRLEVLEKMLEGIEGAQTGLALPKPKRSA